LTDSENGPVMAPADWGGAKDTEEVGSRSLADSENGPLMAPADWGGAKETEEVRAENGHLMAPADWGGAEEVEEAKESRPLASIPLAIGTLPFEVRIPKSKESSKREALAASKEIQVFTDGSVINGKVGAAAVLTRPGKNHRLLHYL
jgi:hypothetical protein